MQQKTILTQIRQIALKDPKTKDNILCTIEKQNQMHITFNRPKNMNAFSIDMYFTFVEYINKANELQNIKFIVIKGAGGNFSSGNDLNNFMNQDIAGLEDKRGVSAGMAKILQELGVSIIESKKPIFCIVDGRCIGFAFTQLALYDKVVATEKSSFMAPLVKIAQGPEMSSSFTFPKVFGQTLAEEMIIKGKWMKPQELQKYNFLTVYKDASEAEKAIQEHIESISELDWPAYMNARRLMRRNDIGKLLEANKLECENLVERWCNEDLPNYLVQYMAKRKSQKPKL